MTTRATFRPGYGTQVFYEDVNFESVRAMAPLWFEDDFVGAGYSAALPAYGSPTIGCPWAAKIVGAAPPTVAVVANASSGQIACALTADSQKQDALLAWNDSLAINLTSGACFESRAAASVPPTGVAQMVLGLAAAWADGPDNIAEYLFFSLEGNGALLCQSYDGTTTNSIAAAQIGQSAIILDTNFHTFRIDCINPADVGFFLDGNRVNAVNSIGFAATGASAILQPMLGMYKASGTGVGTLKIDKVSIWQNRP